MDATEFKTLLDAAFGPWNRFLSVKDGHPTIFVQFYNLPREIVARREGGGAEAENNRMMFTVKPAKDGKFKIETIVNMLDRACTLRAKTGTLQTIATYLGQHLAHVVSTVDPKYTHTKM